MKKEIFKTVFSMLLIAVAVCGFSVSAHAISGETGGSSLLFPYYDLRSDAGLGLTDNYFTVTNTSTDRWVQAHVRVRTGKTSIELLDFDVLLSPTDVFAFDMYDDNGATVFVSCDTKTLNDSGFDLNYDRDGDGTNDCFILASSTFPEMVSLIQTCDSSLSFEEAVAQTKKGYVEIIGEGAILTNSWFNSAGRATTKDKTKCPGIDIFSGDLDNEDDVAIAGKMLDHTNSEFRLCSSSNGEGLCPSACAMLTNQLIGRVYYATVTAGPTLKRLAHLNAEVLDSSSSLILHKESYTAELEDVDCAGTDAWDGCYAYAEAEDSTGAIANGADDMNLCLYTDSIITAEGVVGVRNKYGAGATYGPTLADIVGYRDGTLARTRSFLNQVSTFLSIGYFTMDGIPLTGPFKTFADSHYLSVPAGAGDLVSKFAFIFPVQHFIGERNVLTPKAVYDNEENTTTTPLGKFISPGLPTTSQPGDEASLFTLNAPFFEGWVRWTTEATNATRINACDPGEVCLGNRNTDTLVRSGSTGYLPGYIGNVFNVGADSLGASNFQYNDPNWENLNLGEID